MRNIGKGHGVTFFVVGILAVLVSLARGVPQAQDFKQGADSQAAQLSRAVGKSVIPGSLVWIEADVLFDFQAAITWQEMLFLASLAPSQPADLFRAEVRLDNQKNIIAIRGLRNLTHSPAGDEFAIAANWPLAVVATRHLDR